MLTVVSYVSYGQNTSDDKKQILYSSKGPTHFNIDTKTAYLSGDVELVLNDLYLKASTIEVDFINHTITARSSESNPSFPTGPNTISSIEADPIIVKTNLDGYSLMPLQAEVNKN